MTTPRINIVDSRTHSRARVWKVGASCLVASGAFFGPGVIVDSAAMQWAGFVVFITMFFGAVGMVFDPGKALTVDEARAYLDRLEAAAE